jgi:hypothetical protein
MPETIAQLPILLVPRRSYVLFQLFLMLVWCGFVVYWADAYLPEFLSGREPLLQQSLSLEHLVLLVPVVMLAVGVFGLVRSVLLIIPGNPYVTLAITQDGLAWRHFAIRRQVAWAEIRQFNLTREKSGKSYKWVLVVNGATSGGDTGALFKIELGKFLPAFGGEKQATAAAAWFNSLLVLARGGKIPDRLALPESLASCLSRRRQLPHGSTGTVATPSTRRNSVIER